MARNPFAIIKRIWGGSPPDDSFVEEPDFTLFRQGYDNRYFKDGGLLPKGEHFNWKLRALFALGKEINEHGILEWDNRNNFPVSYTHLTLPTTPYV